MRVAYRRLRMDTPWNGWVAEFGDIKRCSGALPRPEESSPRKTRNEYAPPKRKVNEIPATPARGAELNTEN